MKTIKMTTLNSRHCSVLPLGFLLIALYCIGMTGLVMLPLQEAIAFVPTMEYYHYNHQGSLLEVYDGKTNKRLLSQTWSPWGERQVLHAAASGDNSQGNLLLHGLPVHMGYTGHTTLLATGLVFAGDTRLYDPRLKRFLNSDDRTTGAIRGQNRYSYAYNNPMSYVDHNGRSPTFTLSSSRALHWSRKAYHALGHGGQLNAAVTGVTTLARLSSTISRGHLYQGETNRLTSTNHLTRSAVKERYMTTVAAQIINSSGSYGRPTILNFVNSESYEHHDFNEWVTFRDDTGEASPLEVIAADRTLSIFGHGLPDKVFVFSPDHPEALEHGYRTVRADEFSNIIHHTAAFQQVAQRAERSRQRPIINLIMCRTGEARTNGSCFAQDLANELNANVFGAPGIIHFKRPIVADPVDAFDIHPAISNEGIFGSDGFDADISLKPKLFKPQASWTR